MPLDAAAKPAQAKPSPMHLQARTSISPCRLMRPRSRRLRRSPSQLLPPHPRKLLPRTGHEPRQTQGSARVGAGKGACAIFAIPGRRRRTPGRSLKSRARASRQSQTPQKQSVQPATVQNRAAPTDDKPQVARQAETAKPVAGELLQRQQNLLLRRKLFPARRSKRTQDCVLRPTSPEDSAPDQPQTVKTSRPAWPKALRMNSSRAAPDARGDASAGNSHRTASPVSEIGAKGEVCAVGNGHSRRLTEGRSKRVNTCQVTPRPQEGTRVAAVAAAAGAEAASFTSASVPSTLAPRSRPAWTPSRRTSRSSCCLPSPATSLSWRYRSTCSRFRIAC